MRSRLPCRGHCLHPGTLFFKYVCLSGGAELLPRTPGERPPGFRRESGDPQQFVSRKEDDRRFHKRPFANTLQFSEGKAI